MQLTGPDYRCVGQADGTFLCEKLTINAVDIAWLGFTGALVIVLTVMLVFDWRQARVRRRGVQRPRNRRGSVHSVSGPRE